MRAFIAVELDPGIKESLLALVRGLRGTRAAVRWVAPAGMHLTLKFLGAIDEDQARKVREVLTEVAARHPPFPIEVKGTGAFPSDRNPRVLWVGFSHVPELLALQGDLDRALESEGFERETRDFTPHLTLGRVQGPDRLAHAMAELANHRDRSFGVMTVKRLTLFESLLHPEGAEYRTVLEVPLS